MRNVGRGFNPKDDTETVGTSANPFKELYAVTPTTTDNSKKVATTEWVMNKLNALDLGGGSKKKLTGDTTFYIRQDGNDNNDGSANTAAKALKTVTGCFNYLRGIDPNGYRVILSFLPGTSYGRFILHENLNADVFRYIELKRSDTSGSVVFSTLQVYGNKQLLVGGGITVVCTGTEHAAYVASYFAMLELWGACTISGHAKNGLQASWGGIIKFCCGMWVDNFQADKYFASAIYGGQIIIEHPDPDNGEYAWVSGTSTGIRYYCRWNGIISGEINDPAGDMWPGSSYGQCHYTDGSVYAGLGGLQTAKPIGDIYPWASHNPPAGGIPLQVEPYQRAMYPDLWTFADWSENIVDDSVWLQEYNTYGSCGHFSRGDGSTTFRTPVVNCFVRGKSPTQALGEFQNDAIRNITGN